MAHVKKFESYKSDDKMEDLSWSDDLNYRSVLDEINNIVKMGAIFIDKKHIQYNWSEKKYEFDEETKRVVKEMQDSATMGFIVIEDGVNTDYCGVMFTTDIKILSFGDNILYKWEYDKTFKQK